MSNTVVVVPNHLPHLDFLEEWDELRDVPIIVMQDNDISPSIPTGFDVTVYNHQDAAFELGADAWIIPKRTSACRSYGFYKAWQRRPDFILTLDNDCYPESESDYWVRGHERNLLSRTTLDWVSACSLQFTRGHPYRIRDKALVCLSHGLWSGVPDLDAATALHNPDLRLAPAEKVTRIPRWSFFPMCGMNLGWHRDLTPAMYFGLFGPDYGFDQYDDIWAGVLLKKVMDHLGLAAVTGAPSVEHRKQSDVFVNLRKQAPGLEMNENFWRIVQGISLEDTKTVPTAYAVLIHALPDVIEGEPEGWTLKFKTAALAWLDLFR